MAGKEINKHSLRASTIMEVLISLIIIVIAFSIAMGIFANVQRLSLSNKKLKAQGVLQTYLIAASWHPGISKQTIQNDGFSIEQNITNYKGNPSLFHISLIAYDEKGEKVTELNEVIYEGK